MAKIQILSDEVANKIAAGEVVERPASVVKELVDNAIDAGASQIDVEIEDEGSRLRQGYGEAKVRLISVTDNGEGMDEEDLLNCWKRHGTSKIKEIEDLWRVQSMGFRGEALASITAVSKVTIRTKRKGEVSGKELIVNEGKSGKVSPVGMPEGTKVIVEDLFRNVPARKKFLKTAATEFRHVTQVVNDFALAWPEVGFSLKHNGREVFRYSAIVGDSTIAKVDDSVRQAQDRHSQGRLKQVLGERIVAGLLPVRLDHPHLQISGWVGKPQLCHEMKYKQWLFVNRRRVSDKGLNKVIKQAYGTLLPGKIYPVYILYLEVPPEMVDVNVHPRKEEVKFVNSQMVYGSVIRTVKHGLEREDLGWKVGDGSEKWEVGSGKVRSEKWEVGSEGVAKKRSGSLFEQKKRNTGSYAEQRQATWELNKPLQVAEERLPWGQSAPVGTGQVLQIHNLYLIKETEKGVLIVDQHAAHERVLYEKFVREFKDKNKSIQKQELLVPLVLDLMEEERQLLEENMDIFERLGFEIRDDGGQCRHSGYFDSAQYRFISESKKEKILNQVQDDGNLKMELLAVPVWTANKNLVQLIKEVLYDIEEDNLADKIDDQNLRRLTYMACRSAVKAGDRLSQLEIRHIIESVDLTDVKVTCPHGRPVKVEMGMKELERMFKRSGFGD